MSEMIKTVIKALEDALEKRANEAELYYDRTDDFVDGRLNLDQLARAAIAAMLDPTEAMVMRGTRTMATYQGTREECARLHMWTQYRAMIDEALK